MFWYSVQPTRVAIRTTTTAREVTTHLRKRGLLLPSLIDSAAIFPS
ncbi:Uncharacterised protein [Mycobacteroides abscessus subsp. abscessus]|nr:Uncharacterised protein [Mycobacteroides abscessus subsp. abscessus]